MQQDSQSNLQIPNCRLIFDRMDLRFHFHFAYFFLSSPLVLFCQLCHFLHSSQFMYVFYAYLVTVEHSLHLLYHGNVLLPLFFLFRMYLYLFWITNATAKMLTFMLHIQQLRAMWNMLHVRPNEKQEKWKWTNMAANSFACCSTCHFPFVSLFLSLSLFLHFAEFFFLIRFNVTNTSNWWGFIKYLEWFLIVGMIAA